MKLPFHTYDVFTNRRFGGNPLAIVEEADGLSDAEMQVIAREFNLSETIFVRAPKDKANTASVRIFFPTAEIPFAGHPTVGCAIHLASRKYKQGCSFETTIRLEEVAGLVPVKVSRIGDVPRAEFTAPVIPFAAGPAVPAVEDMARALGIEPGDIDFEGHVMRLLEVVRGKKTGKDVLATCMQLAKTIKKFPVVAGVCDGFIGNVVLKVSEGSQAQLVL